MRDYCIRIRLLSPLGTPWQSDTVFGHLAWHVARGRGGIAVDEFLAPFTQGCPPFVLSDGFPDDLLPRPFLPPSAQAPTTPREYADTKERQKALFVTRTDFAAIRRGDPSSWSPARDPWLRFEMLHAAISRTTNTTTAPGEEQEEGNLFPTALLTTAEGDVLSLYLRADEEWADWVLEMLDDMAPLGFGRDRSTGSGAFEVLASEPFDDFSPIPDANAFVSLSSYCPARDDPTTGRWRLRLKYGRLGENAGQGNPFKRPLVQFEPGAVFLTDGPPRPFYGRAVTGIAPAMPQAIQCCYALAVPCVVSPGLLEAAPS